jgi:hypothetical protein
MMFNKLLPLVFLFACSNAQPRPQPRPQPSPQPESQQQRPNRKAQSELTSEFSVQFNGPQRQIPPGLLYGLNDLQSATDGVWKTWAQGVNAHDGVVRIWVQRFLGKLNNEHIAAAKRAQQAGLGVMLTIVGVTGDKHKRNAVTDDHSLAMPADTKKWAQDFATDTRALIKAGIDVRYIEIWNEPDMPSEWRGSRQEFADFFAQCGVALREELGTTVSIGGPGMASGWGLGMDYFDMLLDSCKKYSFKPDFLSWHHYGSFATDSEFLETPNILLRKAKSRGLGTPEVIMSEWNVSLPSPIAKGMDTNVGAAFWSSMVSSLIQTPTSHALYFFLQDGSWEATEDFAQQSVGAFTLRGAPKATFSAMKLMAEVAKFPAVPLQRQKAINNLTCVATRDQDTGHLLLTNANGDILRVARKYLAATELVMGELEGKDKALKAYFSGSIKFEKLQLSEEWRAPLLKTGRVIAALKKEENETNNWVTIQLDAAPKSIKSVRLIDSSHGNPIASASFRKLFAPYEAGFAPIAVKNTLSELAKQGVGQSERNSLQRSFDSGAREKNIAGVSAATMAQSRAIFNRQLKKITLETPAILAAHPDCSAATVDAAKWAKIEGNTILVNLPQHSIVAVEIEL